MKIVFFGTPEFAVPPLEALLNSGHEIIAVVTQPDRRSGRGRRVTPGPVKVLAQQAGLRVLQPATVRERHFINELEALKPSAVVVAAYGQILPSGIIRLPRFGCINIHASLLPRYRGAAPVNWALINGEEKTGVTTMLMDEGMDTGPVLLREEVRITPEDTAGTLSAKLSRIGADLLLRTLHGLENGSIKPVQQSGDPSYAPRLKKTDGMIQWSKPARELCDFIRGMNPWPGAYGFLEGERVRILKAAPAEPAADAGCRPGVICKVTTDEMHVCTGGGAVSILEIQPAGKSAMPVKTFLQGRKLREGMSFNV